MSPPIRDGSGDSIGSIRLGDGSEISEVRTGAGDVVFSAIPDSGDLYAAFLPNFLSNIYTDGDSIPQWSSDDGNITLTEAETTLQPVYDPSVGSNDGSAEFTGQFQGNTEGVYLLETGLADLTENNGFTVGVLLREKSPSNFQGIVAPEFNADGDPNGLWNLRYNNGGYDLVVDGNESLSFPSPSDANKHTLIGTIDGGTGEFYLDGGSPSASTDLSSATFSTTSLSVGQYQLSGPEYYNYDGYIAAVLLYINGKSTTKVNDINDYLMNL